MKRFLKGLAITVGILYLVAGILIYAYQESLLFHPRARSADHRYGDYPEEWIDVDEGVRLNALLLAAEPGERSEQVILFLHGNVGDNGRSLYQTRLLQDLGRDLYLVDYRGFGKSSGELAGESDLTDDFQVVYDRLAQIYGEENIILTGYSMGTGPVSYLAAGNDPHAVVLLAPYTSLTDMKNEFFWMYPDFLLRYELNNRRHLAASKAPVTILHGTADQLIPFRMAEELRDLAPDRIKLVPLEGVSHRGVVSQPEFAEAVRDVLGAG